jgi:hypothetical protein
MRAALVLSVLAIIFGYWNEPYGALALWAVCSTAFLLMFNPQLLKAIRFRDGQGALNRRPLLSVGLLVALMLAGFLVVESFFFLLGRLIDSALPH